VSAAGFLAAVGRALEAGADAIRWENLARVQGDLYFRRHSEDVDDFGFDPRFNAAVMPFFEFL
jgi:hypothetical protein